MPLGSHTGAPPIVPIHVNPVVTRDMGDPVDNWTGRLLSVQASNTGLFTGSANVDLWAPHAAGFRLRLEDLLLIISADAAISSGGVDVTFNILDDVAQTGIMLVAYVPMIASPGGQQVIGPIPIGRRGYVTRVGGHHLVVNTSVALTSGNFLMVGFGTEEGPN